MAKVVIDLFRLSRDAPMYMYMCAHYTSIHVHVHGDQMPPVTQVVSCELSLSLPLHSQLWGVHHAGHYLQSHVRKLCQWHKVGCYLVVSLVDLWNPNSLEKKSDIMCPILHVIWDCKSCSVSSLFNKGVLIRGVALYNSLHLYTVCLACASVECWVQITLLSHWRPCPH